MGLPPDPNWPLGLAGSPTSPVSSRRECWSAPGTVIDRRGCIERYENVTFYAGLGVWSA